MKHERHVTASTIDLLFVRIIICRARQKRACITNTRVIKKVSRENLSLPPKKQNGFKAIVYNPLDFCAGKMGALPIRTMTSQKLEVHSPLNSNSPAQKGGIMRLLFREARPITLGCMAITVGRLWL